MLWAQCFCTAVPPGAFALSLFATKPRFLMSSSCLSFSLFSFPFWWNKRIILQHRQGKTEKEEWGGF